MTKQTLDEQLRALDGPPGYHAQPIPSSLDEALLHTFEHLGMREMRNERERLSKTHRAFADLLGIFGLRMATLAVRKQQPKLATVGLRAFLSMRGSRDERDDIIALALFFDSMQRSGNNPEATLTEVALESPSDRECLLAFLRRSDRDRSIEVMGYRAEGTDENFRYVYQP